MAQTTKYPFVLEWASKLLELFFPTICGGCASLGPIICSNCKSQFSWVTSPICNRCGRHLIHAAKACGHCSSSQFNLHQVRCPLFFREPLKTIIHQMKYSGLYTLAYPLGQIMVDYWPDWDDTPDVIIPIPLHANRLKKRGFNQSALLAVMIGDQVDIPVNSNDLVRIKNTKPQVGLSPDKRKENVHNAFQANVAGIKGKHILLIDDVFTTGATMNAACQSLQDSGAIKVSAFCLARTV